MDISDYLKHTLEGIILVGTVGTGFLAALNILSAAHKKGRKISSREELREIVAEEARNLGIDDTKINVEYSGTDRSRMKDGGYDLEVKWPTTRAIVRHELYHIKKDCGKKRGVLYYFLLAEPRAMLYGLFGLKI